MTLTLVFRWALVILLAASLPARATADPAATNLDTPAGDPEAGLHGTSVRSPRVVIVTDENAASRDQLVRWNEPGGVFEKLRRAGWQIGNSPDQHVQLVTSTEVANDLERWKVVEYPAVLAIEMGEVVRSFQDGCSTPLDAYTFGWLLNGVMERPVPATPLTITVGTSGAYPLRGNHWNIEGRDIVSQPEIARHLRGPNHTGLFPASWPIENWSIEELKSLHDDLHEMNRPRTPHDPSLEVGNSVPPGVSVPIYRPRPSTMASRSQPTTRPGSTARAAGARSTR